MLPSYWGISNLQNANFKIFLSWAYNVKPYFEEFKKKA